MPEEAPSYVERAADRQLMESLLAGKFCYVLNSRQMGKSSLCVRTKQKLEQDGVQTVFIDLTRIGGRNVTAEQWYAGLLVEVGRAAALRNELLAYWKDTGHLSPMQRFFGGLRDVLLEKLQGKVVIFVDEIDSTRSLPFDTDEFFAGIRECFNRRVHDPAYARLTFCLMGVAVPSDLIKNAQTTPFNIGDRIYLRDFTLEEAMALAKGLPGRERLVQRVHHWSNGHPFLTQSLCTAIGRDEAIQTEQDVDDLVAREFFEPKARETNINLADVGNRVLNGYAPGDDIDQFRADILSGYAKALKNKETLPDDESNRVNAVLKLSGLMRSEGKSLKVRNPIYERVFGQEWIRENMPFQETRRQKRAFWLGVLRTTVIAALVVALIGNLAYRNDQLRREANQERDRANYEVYVSDMSLMPVLWERGDIERIRKLLDDTKTNAAKGWEWKLWNRLSHQAVFEMGQDGGFGFALSNDGTRLLLSTTSAFRLLDASSFRVIKDIPRMAHERSQPDFGSDGRTFLEFGSEGTLIRSLDTGDLVAKIPDVFGNVRKYATSPDGRWRLADGDFGKPVLVNLKTLAVKPIPSDTGANSQQFSPDGKLIAWAHDFNDDPRATLGYSILHADSLKPFRTLGSEGAPSTLVFTSDSKHLITGSRTGWLQYWDVATGKELWRLKAHEQGVLRLDLSTDDRRLLTAGRERFAKVFELSPTGAREIRRYPDAANAQISPDGKRAYLAYWTLRVYDIDASESTPSIQLPSKEVFGQTIHGDGTVVAASTNGAYLVDALGKRDIRTFAGPNDVPASFSQYRPYYLAANQSDGWVIKDYSRRTPVASIALKRSEWFPALDMPATTEWLMATNNGLGAWDYRAGKFSWKRQFKVGGTAAAVSKDGQTLVVGMFTGLLQIIDLKSGQTRELTPHFAPIWSITFSADDTRVITCSDDDTSSVIELASGKEILKLTGHSQTVRSADISPDGTRYATASDDKTVRIWDAKTGRELTVLTGHKSELRLVRFVDNGRILVSVDRSGLIMVWPTVDLPKDGL